MSISVDITSSLNATIRRDTEQNIPYLWKCGSADGDAANWYYRSLMYFDLSTISKTAKFSEAKIKWYLSSNTGAISADFKVYGVDQEWNPSYVTRTYRKSGVGWVSTPGDYSGECASLNLIASESTGYKYWTFTSGGLAILQNILSGVHSNYGFLIKSSESGADQHVFDSTAILQLTYTKIENQQPILFF